MFMICVHNKLHMANSSGSLCITTKLKTECRFYATISLFHIL